MEHWNFFLMISKHKTRLVEHLLLSFGSEFWNFFKWILTQRSHDDWYFMTHIYVEPSCLKYQSIPSYYGYGIENGTTTATGSESFFNKILVWLVLNMRWNSKRSSYRWIIYLNHTFTYQKKRYQKVSDAVIFCTPRNGPGPKSNWWVRGSLIITTDYFQMQA